MGVFRFRRDSKKSRTGFNSPTSTIYNNKEHYYTIDMQEYIVEFIDPQFEETQFARCEGLDRTDARDIFYDNNPNVERIVKLTRVHALEV